MKLFSVYLGGKKGNSHIELHDIRFVIGETIEDTYAALREEWFGDPQGLHIDAYTELKYVDGYEVSLSQEQPIQEERLYFINMGGYSPTIFTELHEVGFFVASTAQEAKEKAKAALLTRVEHQHKDNLYEVDDCIEVHSIGKYFISLTPSSIIRPLVPDWFGYKRIDKDYEK